MSEECTHDHGDRCSADWATANDKSCNVHPCHSVRLWPVLQCPVLQFQRPHEMLHLWHLLQHCACVCDRWKGDFRLTLTRWRQVWVASTTSGFCQMPCVTTTMSWSLKLWRHQSSYLSRPDDRHLYSPVSRFTSSHIALVVYFLSFCCEILLSGVLDWIIHLFICGHL